MSYANYHIDNNSPNRFYEYIVNFLSFFSSVLNRKNWRTGLVCSFNNKLAKWHLYSEGLKSVVKKFEKEAALKKHSTVLKMLKDFRSLYSQLEKIKFFKNPETEELIEGIVSNLYSAEASLRNIAYTEDCNNDEDQSLKEFASRLSLGSLQV
jgi:hypothetical protein